MKKILLLFVLIMVFAITIAAQIKTGTVISTQANLRGTPDSQGEIMAIVEEDETFELIQQKGVWFLIQSSKYVGWIHGNSIRLGSIKPTQISQTPKKPKPLPAGTVVNNESGGFQEEYIGANYPPTVVIKNDTVRILTLVFGGVSYKIAAGKEETIIIDPEHINTLHQCQAFVGKRARAVLIQDIDIPGFFTLSLNSCRLIFTMRRLLISSGGLNR